MSALNPVLYGQRLYGRNLYSANPDPVTTTLSMSESVGSTDALVNDATKALAELITFLDSLTKSATKPLSDTVSTTETLTKLVTRLLADTTTLADSVGHIVRKSLDERDIFITPTLYGTSLYGRSLYSASVDETNPSVRVVDQLVVSIQKLLSDTTTMSDSVIHTIVKALSDNMTLTDSGIIVVLTKAFNEILLLQDWLSIRLQKPNLWNVSVVVTPSLSLYGRILFGRKLYSGQGGSSVTWNTQPVVRPNAGWKSFNQLEERS